MISNLAWVLCEYECGVGSENIWEIYETRQGNWSVSFEHVYGDDL